MADTDESYKLHAACDECRKRKLKCSGQITGCTRCVKQDLICHYSAQKQMGRPRKKQKVADGLEESNPLDTDWLNLSFSNETGQSQAHQPSWNELDIVDHSLCPRPDLNFTASSTSPATAPLSEGSVFHGLSSFSNGHADTDSDVTPPSNSPPTPSLSTIAESFPFTFDWNDYSILPSRNTSLPAIKAFPPINESSTISAPASAQSYPPNTSVIQPQTTPLSAKPSCTCLPDLYLTLTNLSTLPSLPINPHTVETLQAATRTAHSVLYCPICPQNFQSGMQNVGLLSTLLQVLADGWSRILSAPAKDLARGFDLDPTTTLSSDSDLADSWTPAKETQWKLFAHYLVRHYVFGDAPPPGIHMPGICPMLSSSTTAPLNKPPIVILHNLCHAMERRQKEWHGAMEASGEFPPHCSSDEAMLRLGEGDGGGGSASEDRVKSVMEMRSHRSELMCVKIVESVRTMLRRLDRPRPSPRPLREEEVVEATAGAA